MQAEPDFLRTRTRSRLTLLVIAALFVAPLLIAWAFVSGVFDWHGRGMLNKGSLIDPPIELTSAGAAAAALHGGNGTWSVVYLGNGACDAGCGADLVNLDKVYQLIAHDQTRVRMYVAGTRLPAGAPAALQPLVLPDAALRALDGALAQRAAPGRPMIGLVDFRGFLMMGYPPGDDPDHVLDDLKRLLRASDPG